jgi:hypothetical protein
MTKATAIHYRQGDVLIRRIARLPRKTVTPAPDCILAHGEATGHAHRVLSGASMFVTVEGRKYLEVFDEGATVTHEEHGPVFLPGPARYEVRIQREFSPEAIRDVRD